MSPTIDDRLLSDLNEAQRGAVLHGEGPLLILAGAGSGKTRVITRRIAYLILTGQVDPMRIVAITFTNKAAREMKERVAALVNRAGLWVSTFHSMAARILRREADAIGIRSDFTIYDTYDRGQCLRAVVRELDLDEGVHRPGALGHRISGRKNRGLKPGEPDPDTGRLDPVLARIEKAYAEKLAQSQALDFDDLLLVLVGLLEERPEVAERYTEWFQHVLVDEYQDTNRIQYRITRALAGQRRNLCVCGDPDQSIYGWRGADLDNILDFEREFAPVKVVRLETNYRSKRNILDAAQAVIEHNTRRKAKRLLTDADPGEKLWVALAEDELDEARFVASQIARLTSGGRWRHGDVAVFYRANFLQRALEKGLRDAGIPYRVASGLEFFERREIKDVLAYARLLVNPADDVAFERVVNVPARGIGEVTLERIRAEAALRGTPLLEACRLREVAGRLTPRARAAVEEFLRLLSDCMPLASESAEAAVQGIVNATRYEDHCGALGDGLDVERIENVRELAYAAREFDAREPGAGLAGFLAEVALVSDTDRLSGEGDAVTLMTLHAAKGLEFPVVFIAGLEDGLLPHRRSMDERSGGDGLEEERRLFYVGLTRARERVFLSRARYRNQFGSEGRPAFGETVPSRFLREIPDELLEGDRLGAFDDAMDDDRHSQVDEGEPDRAPRSPGGAVATFTAGQVVHHGHFGIGRILEIRGSGKEARAVVAFRDAGEKQLLLQYARLEAVREGSRNG